MAPGCDSRSLQHLWDSPRPSTHFHLKEAPSHRADTDLPFILRGTSSIGWSNQLTQNCLSNYKAITPLEAKESPRMSHFEHQHPILDQTSTDRQEGFFTDSGEIGDVLGLRNVVRIRIEPTLVAPNQLLPYFSQVRPDGHGWTNFNHSGSSTKPQTCQTQNPTSMVAIGKRLNLDVSPSPINSCKGSASLMSS